MSIWSHLTGVVRIDGIPSFDKYTKEKLEEFIGEPWTFDKLDNHLKDFLRKNNDDFENYESPLDTSEIPFGSEGGIDYKVHIYGTGFPWAVVAFWGDLRDYDDIKPLEEWLKDLLNRLQKEGYWLRQFSFSIECSSGEIIDITSNNYKVKNDN